MCCNIHFKNLHEGIYGLFMLIIPDIYTTDTNDTRTLIVYIALHLME
jgi:hypothetical protein